MDYKNMYKEFVKLIHSTPDGIQKFSRTMMKTNFDDEDYWKHIFEIVIFEDQLIKEYIDDINIEYLIKYQNLSADTLTWLEQTQQMSNNPNYLQLLVEYQVLPLDLLNTYFDKVPLQELDWKNLAFNQNLTDEVIEKYQDKWDWDIISQEQLLTLNIVSKFHLKLNWEVMPMNLKTQYLFNDSFVLFFQDKPIWNNIGWMDKVTADCLWQFKHRITPLGWYSILEHKELPYENLVSFIDDIMPLEPKLDSKRCWSLICESQHLDETLLDKYHAHLDWSQVSMFQNLSWELIEKYASDIDLKYLANNDCFTDDIAAKIKDNQDKFKGSLDDGSDLDSE